jgi:hypothetical protein
MLDLAHIRVLCIILADLTNVYKRYLVFSYLLAKILCPLMFTWLINISVSRKTTTKLQRTAYMLRQMI